MAPAAVTNSNASATVVSKPRRDWLFQRHDDDQPIDNKRSLEISVWWGDCPLSIDRVSSNRKVTIGTHASNLVRLASREFGARFVIAEATAKDTQIRIPSSVSFVTIGDRGEQLDRDALSNAGRLKFGSNDDDVESFVLQHNERVEVLIGALRVVIRTVRWSTVRSSGWAPVDRRFVSSIALWLALYGLFIFMTMKRATEAPSLGDDRLSRQAKYVRMLVLPEQPKPQKSKAGRGGGKPAKEREGKAGAQIDPSEASAPAPANVASSVDRRKVKNLMSGLLGRGGTFGAGGAAGPLGSGIDRAVSGLNASGGGTAVGGGIGFGGLGTRGSGVGGGGSGLGLGGSSGIGAGGDGLGSGGGGSHDLGSQSKDSVRVIPGTTTIVGGLDRDEILKVIRRHQNEIKFCYEQELQKRSDLAGKVSVTWTIDAAGFVIETHIAESSLANAEVESCMLSRIRRWKFPEPEGGTEVTVTFPWMLKMAGSD